MIMGFERQDNELVNGYKDLAMAWKQECKIREADKKEAVDMLIKEVEKWRRLFFYITFAFLAALGLLIVALLFPY